MAEHLGGKSQNRSKVLTVQGQQGRRKLKVKVNDLDWVAGLTTDHLKA